MKVWIERLKRKSGDKLAVKVVDANGKKMQRGLFELNQKRQAKVFADSLKQQEDHLAMPAQITFDTAFAEYKESVLKNELIVYETRLHMVGKVNNHIIPHIDKKLLTDFTYHDFKEDYIPKLINSESCRVVNIASKDKYGFTTKVIRSGKKLGKKAIKDSVAEFKLFVKYCLDRKWVIDPNILTFKFNKNFFQNENTQQKWMPKYKDVVKLINSATDPINVVLFHTAAETGMRLNELLALTYTDVDLTSKPALLYTNHSMDKWNNFRENFLKTASSKRPIEISNTLAIKLKEWMDTQVNPRKVGKYRLLFPMSKKMAARRVQRAAKKLGIDWQNGISPFRKFAFSYLKDQQALTDKQIMRRFGWSNMNTPNKWYYRDLDTNKDQRLAAIDKMLLN